MITGNKGEWSEIYVFLKLLAEGKLFAANKNLKKLTDIYYPIISILRIENGKQLNYKRNSLIKVIEEGTKNVLLELPIERFKVISLKLLDRIKQENGSFSCKEIESFLQVIKIENIKSSSIKKEDITVVVHDFRTGLSPKLSFSIKSMLGSPSTLLNAGRSTNFNFVLTNPKNLIKESSTANPYEEEKIKRLLSKKISEGYALKFLNVDNPIFESNLRMIDSLLPEILSNILIEYYLGKSSAIKDLTAILEKSDPLSFERNKKRFYSHKIKSFLLDVALGMTPASKWEGNYDATGGYIIVKDDGDIVCYHIYNINEFKDYLFENTKLDTPSTSRHDFGKIYTENEDTKIKLNLQIRFLK